MTLGSDKSERLSWPDEKTRETVQRFLDLVDVMHRLRGPRGCPWDKKQTPESLKKFILEEAYEVVDAIDRQDTWGIREELGDLFFQVLFLAYIQEESGAFDLSDVFLGAYQKMVRRHPHVFGDSQDLTVDEIRANWSRIKSEEKNGQNHLFDGRETALPALHHSHKIGERAANVGFDWETPDEVQEKVHEEIDEVLRADQDGDRNKLEEELGDLLFAVSNWVRKYGFEPEETLRAANRKFTARFTKMEKLARNRGLIFKDLPMKEKDLLWEETKK